MPEPCHALIRSYKVCAHPKMRERERESKESFFFSGHTEMLVARDGMRFAGGYWAYMF